MVINKKNMGKILVIAEKPSVAVDITRALGGFSNDKNKDFFESEEFVVSSAMGHLLEICPPPGVESAKGKWSLANLPVIPKTFSLKPNPKTESRLKLLIKLMKRKDVSGIINACDAGREGELIFRYILQYSESELPIRRLWLQSMTAQAIREGFRRLRTDEEMLPLADAAACRSEADWLIGINGTRAMTAFNSREGGFLKTTVGRVQTPTLTMIVEREEKIQSFIPKAYFEIHGTFGCEAGQYVGIWFNPDFSRSAEDKDSKAQRIWKKEEAERILKECVGQTGIVAEESKKKTELSQPLFDLTSLQREANSRYGFPARRTLQIAQALYEKHKVLTYPRTDSRALPEDYLGEVRSIMQSLKKTVFSELAGQILGSGWICPNKRIFNNTKISDHFAIIPTGAIEKLDGDDLKIYDLVVRRFLAVFFPAAEYLITNRTTHVGEHLFKSEGRVLLSPGWTAVYGRQVSENAENPSLPPVLPKERVSADELELKSCETTPPSRFSEATLLTAMETAGKFVEDEELRDAMNEKGLGTPATRASIIEGLIAETYIQRSGKEIIPTLKAFDLITLLRGLKLPELCSPELTGDWEFKLKQVEQRQLRREEFMEMIRSMTSSIVDKVRGFEEEIPVHFASIETPCPCCGGRMVEMYRKYHCEGCRFTVWKVMSGRRISREELVQLLRSGKIGPLDGFVSKMGRPFSASLKLNEEEWKADFDFGENERQTGKKEIDFSGLTPQGACPKCGGNVFETDDAYLCENSQAQKGKKCTFRAGKVILGQPVSREQFQKLLTQGKTDLLTEFFSQKKKKKFSAFLVLDSKKGVGFEFEPREQGTKGGTRSPKQKITADQKKNVDLGMAENGTENKEIDFSGLAPQGVCPKCGGNVFETDDTYLCENSQAQKGKKCTFRAGKVILGQPVSREQFQKLLTQGKTDLLTEFFSQKKKKKFSAFLVLDSKKGVGFEFETRDQGPTVTKSAEKKSAAQKGKSV